MGSVITVQFGADDAGAELLGFACTTAWRLMKELETRPLTGTEAAVIHGTVKSQAGEVLSRLRDHGLVNQRGNPDDKRSVLWEMTDFGRDVFATVQSIGAHPPPASGGGWMLAVKLGERAVPADTRRLLEELQPMRTYRVSGDFDFLAVSPKSADDADIVAALRPRLRTEAKVERSWLALATPAGG